MAEQRRQPQRQYTRQVGRSAGNRSYIEGSTARRLAPERVYVPEQETKRRTEPRKEERAAKAINVHKGIDFITMIFLIAVITAAVLTCFRYLELQSGNQELDKAILAEKSRLSELVDKNDFAELEFEQPIDFDAVYQKAVGSLGMVFPQDGQIITYKPNIHEYVRQNGAGIEDDKISTLLDILFRKE